MNTINKAGTAGQAAVLSARERADILKHTAAAIAAIRPLVVGLQSRDFEFVAVQVAIAAAHLEDHPEAVGEASRLIGMMAEHRLRSKLRSAPGTVLRLILASKGGAA